MPQPHNEHATGDIGMRARIAALDLVRAAQAKRTGFDEAVANPAFLALSESERSFARAMALLLLRRLGQIDHVIDRRLKKEPNDEVIDLLRLGLAQIGYMNVPDFAAVSTTVKLAERSNATRPYKGLINAILRGVLRDRAAGRDPLAAPDLFDQLLGHRHDASAFPLAAGLDTGFVSLRMRLERERTSSPSRF